MLKPIQSSYSNWKDAKRLTLTRKLCLCFFKERYFVFLWLELKLSVVSIWALKFPDHSSMRVSVFSKIPWLKIKTKMFGIGMEDFLEVAFAKIGQCAERRRFYDTFWSTPSLHFFQWRLASLGSLCYVSARASKSDLVWKKKLKKSC